MSRLQQDKRSAQLKTLRKVAAFASKRVAKPQPGELAGQPFDRELLAWSALYRKSRALYLESGGRFEASLVTSPRTLSSAILLEPRIEYSPTERELVWSTTDPSESQDPGHFILIRSYTSSLFHEQNHRILWRELPPPPLANESVRRYLHLAEALVVASDMALADELKPSRAGPLYEVGSIYNPGSEARAELNGRQYRNYLHVIAYVTYLLLELNEPDEIRPWLAALFPQVLPRIRERAWARASKIDPQFVRVTNPFWQERYEGKVAPVLRKGRSREAPLELPVDASDSREFYLRAEAWFSRIGI